MPDACVPRRSPQPPGSPVVVIGGGFIGLEVASALATHGLRPTVVEMATSLWGGTLGIELAAWASDRLAEIGVELRLGTAVSRLADGAAWLDEDRLPATFAVAGIGVVPREDLAEAAGIAVADGILVGADQRTSHPAVWAAGDVARVDGRRVEHWHAAREAGERAGLSMLGLPVPAVPPPWVFSEIAGTMVDVVGAVDGWDEERWLDAGPPDRVPGLGATGRAGEHRQCPRGRDRSATGCRPRVAGGGGGAGKPTVPLG